MKINEDMHDIQIDDAALDREIAAAVRDVAGKRAIMDGWDRSIKTRSRRRKVVAWSVLTASCAAALVMFFVTTVFISPKNPAAPEPVLRGGTSYETALRQIDSLISVGEVTLAAERLDSLKARAEYERMLIDDVIARIDELENKVKK